MPMPGAPKQAPAVTPRRFSFYAIDGARHRTVALPLLLNSNQRDRINQAVGQQEVAIRRDRGVAHDVATARDRPSLEFRGLRIESHDRIRGRPGLAVPDDILDRRHAVGLGLRPARALPLGHLASRGIETTQITAREIAVPDDIVAGDCDPPWAACCIWQ